MQTGNSSARNPFPTPIHTLARSAFAQLIERITFAFAGRFLFARRFRLAGRGLAARAREHFPRMQFSFVAALSPTWRFFARALHRAALFCSPRRRSRREREQKNNQRLKPFKGLIPFFNLLFIFPLFSISRAAKRVSFCSGIRDAVILALRNKSACI